MTIQVDGRACGVIHHRRDPKDPKREEKAELYLFRYPEDPTGSYLAAEHHGPDAFQELADFAEELCTAFELADIYVLTQGRLGLHRDLPRLRALLQRGR